MPNRKILKLNNSFKNVTGYEEHISKIYLSGFKNKIIDLEDDETIALTDFVYYKVNSLSVYSSLENVSEKFTNAAGNITSLARTSSKAIAMAFYSSPEKDTSIYIGTDYSVAGEMIKNFETNFQNCSTEVGWIPKKQLSLVQTHCGVINSSANIKLSDINGVLRLFCEHCLISFVLVPCSEDEIRNNLEVVNALIEEYESISRRNTPIGSMRTGTFENENQKVNSWLNKLRHEKERLEKGVTEGLFHALIYVCAEKEETYKQISTGLLAALGSDNQETNIYADCLKVRNSLACENQWRLPVSNWDRNKIEGLTLYDLSFANLYSLDEANALFLFPTESLSGYRINFYGEARDEFHFFDRAYENRMERAIIMGDVIDGISNYPLQIDDFRTHTFVTGATQTGKSTTTKRIVYQLMQKDIPVVIIEPAKSDYWELKKLEKTEKLKVYSFKNDANDLYFNPFKPEEGVLIDTHIQSLIQALISMFDAEDPLPQLIQRLVYYCYESKGIDINKRATESDEIDYPTFNDMRNCINTCVDEIYAEGEINNNMKGVLEVRLGSLIRGNVGKALSSKKSVSIEEMFATSSIIELDGLYDYTKAFLTSIITTRVNEYVRRQRQSNTLTRLLVIEEAHNLLPSITNTSSKTQRMMSQYFANMLAEISSTGTGIVIVDQRPSAISDAALANTSIKVCHALREENDKRAVANSLALTEFQAQRFSNLKVGEAVIKSASYEDTCIVKIDNSLPYNEFATAACVFCNNQRYCQSSRNHISQYDKNYLIANGVSIRNLLTVLDNIAERYVRTFLKSEKMCIAGNLLASVEANSIVNREVLYNLSKTIEKE